MPQISFPTAALTPDAFGCFAGAGVFIGAINTNPEVLGNRIDVVVTQQNGTPVTIHAAAQPFTLNAGGMLVYGGFPVLMSTATPYSMSIVPITGNTLYFPNSGSGSDVNTSVVVLNVQSGNPAPIAGAGQWYTKTIGGIAEAFYEDSTGQVIQITNNGSLNVDLGTATVQAQIFDAVQQVQGTQFRGIPITLTIDGSNNVDCDLSLGLNYELTLDQNVTNFNFTNAPTVHVPNICVDIVNTGSYTIGNFVPQATYTISIPYTASGLAPAASSRTSYGVSLMPNKHLNIFPVLMKDYP